MNETKTPKEEQHQDQAPEPTGAGEERAGMDRPGHIGSMYTGETIGGAPAPAPAREE
jgi:hypothetical protein